MPRGPKPAEAIALTLEELKEVRHTARLRETASHGRVLRAQIILTAYEHPEWNNAQLARKLGTTVGTVHKWRKRWGATRTLAEAQRPGGAVPFFPPASEPRLPLSPVRCPETRGVPYLAGPALRLPSPPSPRGSFPPFLPRPLPAGCAKTRSSLGNTTRGSNRPIRASWKRPRSS